MSRKESRCAYYMQRYGASCEIVYGIGTKALDRMTEDGRAVMFSTLRWEKRKLGFRKPKGVSTGEIVPRIVLRPPSKPDWETAFQCLLAQPVPGERRIRREVELVAEVNVCEKNVAAMMTLASKARVA